MKNALYLTLMFGILSCGQSNRNQTTDEIISDSSLVKDGVKQLWIWAKQASYSPANYSPAKIICKEDVIPIVVSAGRNCIDDPEICPNNRRNSRYVNVADGRWRYSVWINGNPFTTERVTMQIYKHMIPDTEQSLWMSGKPNQSPETVMEYNRPTSYVTTGPETHSFLEEWQYITKRAAQFFY